MSFPSDQKLFNIRFAVINYLAGKRNQFVYQLEGFETEWNYSRHVSFARASYSNLPPGEYVFKVKDVYKRQGLGFERLLLFVTGMANIRDVIPFPRTPRNAAF